MTLLHVTLGAGAAARTHRVSRRRPTRTLCGRPIWGAQKTCDPTVNCKVCLGSRETKRDKAAMALPRI